MSLRCAEASELAGESLAGTGVTASSWLLVEVPGSWPRDVASADTLSARAARAVRAWLDATPRSRLQFIRRPDRERGSSLVFVVAAGETEPAVRRIELSSPEELGSVDLATAGDLVQASLVLVCGHGSRDRCCALRGTAVFGALRGHLSEEQLWVSSHQGGHRFAANVLVLPAGLQFGRLGAADAPAVVERALAGRIELGRYRGRTYYDGAAQAAEHLVRLKGELDGVEDLRHEGSGDGIVVFRSADGTEWTVAVDESEGPAVPASCGDEPAPQPVRSARLLESASGSATAGARTRDR
jgi:hypothetical protein